MKNKEIEIKLRLNDDTSAKVSTFLENHARFVKEVTQDDRYYQPKGNSYIQKDGSIYEWLRLRNDGGKNILCYKLIHVDDGNNRYKDEYETVVEDPEQMDNILVATGFVSLVRVVKNRKVYDFEHEGHKYEIALDTIDDLGSFIEVEVKGSFESIKEANRGLESVANVLGLDLEKENYLGYAHMLLLKNGNAPKPDWVSKEEMEYSIYGKVNREEK